MLREGCYDYLVKMKLSQSAPRMLGSVHSWFPPTPVWSRSLYCRGCGPSRLFLALVIMDVFPEGLDWSFGSGLLLSNRVISFVLSFLGPCPSAFLPCLEQGKVFTRSWFARASFLIQETE